MSHPSHLFTLRLWLEELGSSGSEWRGQLQLVASGETRYFRDWQALVSHLNELLAVTRDEHDQLADTDFTGHTAA